MAKKKEKKEREIEFKMYEIPKPTINAKTVGALKTLMSDPGFKCDLKHRYEGIVEAYEAGSKANKEKK